MERRTLIFVFLSLTVWYTWLALFPPEIPVEQQASDAVASEVADVPPVEAAPAPERAVPQREVPVAICGSRGRWSNQGGGLRDLLLPDRRAPYEVTPIYSWILGGFGPWSPYGEEPGPARVVSERARTFTVGVGALTDAPVPLEGTPLDGVAQGRRGSVVVEQRFEPRGGEPCAFVATYTWRNEGDQPFDGALWIGAHDVLPEGDGMMARYTSQASAVASIGESVWTLTGFDELTQPQQVDDEAVDWLGMGDRYHAAYLVPDRAHGELWQSRVMADGGPLDGMQWVVKRGLQPGEVHRESLLLYVGPKDTDLLEALHPALGNAVELGWFAFFGHPLLWLLKLYHGLVGNWGVAIILLTVTVKALFFPLTQSAFRSGQAMQAIQPELQKIRETYKDDPAELNRRTLELFKEHKVSPLGGCLPMLLQFPVWIALYNVLLTSVELYQTEFLYLKDLSSPDPYCVLPVSMMVIMAIQQRFTPMQNMDPMQAKMMKLMPLVFGLFFFVMPAGLVIYTVVNMVLSVLQQWYIKRTFASPEASVAHG